MSMLAEPKKKIKWGLNPRGNFWANDDNKVGQKLLEKMGWKKGKGLGKNENGLQSNIKLSSQESTKGIGWDRNDAYVPHQDNFNALLQELNVKHSASNSSKIESEAVADEKSSSGKDIFRSLEVRSKTLKSRIHYKKFVCGKDVSQYSSEDLGCIFGRKRNADVSDNNMEDISLVDKDKIKTANKCITSDSSSSTLYTSQSNMADYFAQKMKTKKALTEQKEIKESSELKIENSSKSKKTKKRKRDENSEIIVDSNLETNGLSLTTSDDILTNITTSKTKKSKKVHSNVENKKMKDYKQIVEISSSSENDFLEEIKNNSAIPPETNTQETTSKIKKSKKRRSNIESKKIEDNKQIVKISSSSENDTSDEIEYNVATPSKANNTQDLNGVLETQLSLPQLSVYKETEKSAVKNPKNSPATSKNTKNSTERLADALLLNRYSVLSRNLNKAANNPFNRNTENWVVILKLARKQSRYKSLCENFSKHKIFSTTNLLDIPGYGTSLDR